MTPQPTATLARHARTVPPEAQHGHDSACFWDVQDCRWQCVTHPTVGYTLERCTAIGQAVADGGPETRQ
jgi:hypothetical protein